MQYFGGKSKISQELANIINSHGAKSYYEPFCGGLWVTSKVTTRPAYVSNACKPLISLYKAMQKGWVPPTSLTKEEYYKIKERMDLEDPMTAFAGFGCSFAGKWFGGYAKNDKHQNYAQAASRSLVRKFETLADIYIYESDYREIEPKPGSLIYLDPPYANTTAYGAVGSFNSEEFWAKVREWSKENTVLVSEYSAPIDFKEVWAKTTDLSIRNKDNVREARVEKLFTWVG